MRIRPHLIALGLLALLPTVVLARGNEESNIRSLDEGEAGAPASIEDIAWLAGSWTGEGFGGTIEEVWSMPQGAAMMGMFRHLENDATTFYELELIVEKNGSLAWLVKHFSAEFVGWEDKEGYVSFPLVEISEDAAYFDGLTIQRDGPDALNLWLRVGTGGDVHEEKLRLTRSPLVPGE